MALAGNGDIALLIALGGIVIAFVLALIAWRPVPLLIAGTVLVVTILIIPRLLRTDHGGWNESSAVSNLRTINTCQINYLSTAGGSYGRIDDLIKDSLLGDHFRGPVSGYIFNIDVWADGKEYTASAVPASPNNGRFAYYTLPDGVVRYTTTASLAPPGMAGLPVQ